MTLKASFLKVMVVDVDLCSSSSSMADDFGLGGNSIDFDKRPKRAAKGFLKRTERDTCTG